MVLIELWNNGFSDNDSIYMGNAVTVIVGAGAVLDFDHKGVVPSVKNMTEEVLKLSIQKVDGGERPLLRELNDFIVGKLNRVGQPEINRWIPPQLNFESLLHIVEMCISYSGCWHKEYAFWSAYPEFGTLIQPEDFLKDIQTYDYIRAAAGLQEMVMSIVNQYDTSFREDTASEQWYRDFWRSLSGNLNIFNLNYDNTIENSLGEYEDGFLPIKEGEEYSHFSAKQYLENPKCLSTIAHLHGQILFSEAKSFPFEHSTRDMVKNRDYQTARKNRMMRQQNPSNQAKEEYIQPYIVSGSRKTEKMTFAPNNVYLSDLTRKVVENSRLLIIGYSFGDLYLNEILGLGIAAHGENFKVVIIDRFPPYISTYTSLFQHLSNRCNPQLHRFVSRLAGNKLSVEIGQDVFPIMVEGYDEPAISRNGNLMLCYNGFKNAVEKHGEAIRRHLRM